VAEIVWLASYPKSGNTWLRVLLANYIRDSDTPADINVLGEGSIASARIWFDEWVGVEASALDDETIERLRPGVYRCLAREARRTIFMKVHDAWRVTSDGEGLFPADVTAGVVYIVRNPLDLVGSCASHWGVDLQEAADRLCDPAFAVARSIGGLADQLCQRLGCWSGHVRSWLDDSALPVHLVSYERMLSDPHAAFGAIVRFCGLPFDAERVSKAVAYSAFDELQRQEKAAGFVERSARSTAPFFRQGRAGAWRGELTDGLREQIVASHGDAMRRLAYLDENNSLSDS
jgi:hypothetical protein